MVALARAAHDVKLAQYEKRLPLDARGVARAELASTRAVKGDVRKALTRAIYAELAAPELDLYAVDAAFDELTHLAASPR